MKIRTKLSIMILAVTLLSTLLMGGFSYIKSADSLENMSDDSMLSLIKSSAETINAMVEKEQTRMAQLAGESDVRKLLNQAQNGGAADASTLKAVTSRLKEITTEAGNLEHIFVVNLKGDDVADSDEALLGANFSDRAYTKAVLETSEPYISETLKSKLTGAFVLAFAHPVKVDGKLTGFVASAVLANSLTTYLGDIRAVNGSSSYAYIVDDKGVLLFHPTKEKIGGAVENDSIKAVVARVQKGEKPEDAIVSYVFNGLDKKAAYTVLPGTKWTLVLAADVGEIMKPVNDMTTFVVLLGLVSLVVTLLIGLIVSQRITAPILKVTELINKTAELDLKYDASYEHLRKNKDETGIIANAMFRTREALRVMAGSLVSISSKVLHNAEELERLAVDVRENAHDNGATTQELSAGMEETAASTEEMTAAIHEIDSNVGAISEKAKSGAAGAVEIADRALSLREETQKSADHAKELYTSVRGKMEQAIEDSAQIERINELAKTIMEITAQTNLLSLNAGIEAARAGDAGRGFAVVAGEIRKLAERSAQTASGITEIVSGVHTSVDQMRGSSEELLSFIDQNVLTDYDNFLEVSEKYTDDAEMVRNLMEDFQSSAGHLSETVSAITIAINEVAATISESAAGVHDIAERTSDIVEKTFKEAEMADENTVSAKELQRLVEQFKL